MEETIKMKTKNIEGKEIIKDVPKELYSNYVSIGWEEVNDKTSKESNKTLIEKMDKDKNNDNI